MRAIRIFFRSFKDAFRSIFRNFSLSLAAISSTAITLMIVAIAILFTFNINSITKNIEDVLTIVVFVDKDATDEEIATLKEEITNLDNVNKDLVVYNSKDNIKEQLSSNEDLKKVLDTLDENPLKATFSVKVVNVELIDETANNITSLDKVSEVKYGESLASKLVSMLKIIRIACVVAVIALGVVTFFLISNTVKLTIHSRRQEIDIMRLVGTSNTAIRIPFVIEGFVLGIIGSIIPILLTIYGYIFFYDYVGGHLFSELVILVEPSLIIYKTSIVCLIFGGLAGMISSFIAVWRHLKI